VEQRNWQTVRRQVGYDRLSSKAASALLGQLYPLLGLQLNFFRPVPKLVGKERLGAKVIKHYDEPRATAQRLLASGTLSDAARLRLAAELMRLNPAERQRRIDALLHPLWRLGQAERKLVEKIG
jgi:hypothetical protein